MRLVREEQLAFRRRATRDWRELEADLRARIGGEVRFDDGAKALYATDGSNYRQVPIGVVIPRTVEEVVETIAACRAHGAPIVSRGGGTSLAGQCCNVAIVIDFSKYLNHVLEINPGERYARVQPGTILDHLQERAKAFNLTHGPDPATHDHCTLGGMIGNNSCGVHAQMAGKQEENVEELEILTYDGLRMHVGRTSDDEFNRILAAGGQQAQIYRALRELRDRYAHLIRTRYPKIPRRVSGYSLGELLPENGFNVARALVGSESTCVTVLEAKVRLIDRRGQRVILMVGYDDIYSAADHIMEINEAGPVGLEGIDDILVENIRKLGLHAENLPLLPPGKGWLLVEFGADDKRDSLAQANRLKEKLERAGRPTRLYDDVATQDKIWKLRESGLGATARVPGEPLTWEGWEDSAAPPERLAEYLRKLSKLYDEFGYKGALYGHFGQGCVHTRINFDLMTAEGVAKYRRFVERAADLVVSVGGSLSGEHGDGQSRGELLPKMFGPELVRAFEEFKAIWDPDWKMNPGKKVRPYRLDENLRLGADYNPAQPATWFQFPDDDGFADATLRCVGVGKCRRTEGEGTMCPSFMVTREEMHSTRGRAHLLHEMLAGDAITDGWSSEAVKEALDLCLACKGCKGDCPVNVDLATYKAEFLAHYHERHRRPRQAYAFGWIDKWARWVHALRAPRVVNLVTQHQPTAAVAKFIAGMPHQRTIPRFAPMSFVRWWKLRPQHEARKRVVLFPDTFNNYFHPEVAIAAVEVLEAAGFEVIVPTQPICCGRPLYDYGMLDRAQKYVQRFLAVLHPELDRGTPIVALEPSCLSVLKDEAHGLFPHDEDVKRLRQHAMTFAELLNRDGFDPPHLYRDAVLHGHCHHKSLWKLRDEEKLLDRIGLHAQAPETGCCGMAGSFGFEKGKYDISQQIGERVLLPAVRDARRDTLIVADGFSCRTQIAQSSDRRALHVAQVVRMALDRDHHGPAGNFPEARYCVQPQPPPMSRRTKIALVALAAVGVAALVARHRWRS